MQLNDILNTYESKINFIRGIICLAKVDGKIDPNEYEFFLNSMRALNIGNEDIEKFSKELTVDNMDTNISFDNKKQSIFFLKEAIQLCYCDGEYSKCEKDLIREVANKLDISLPTLKAVEQWTLEGVLWSKKGEELLELEV